MDRNAKKMGKGKGQQVSGRKPLFRKVFRMTKRDWARRDKARP